MNPRFVASGIPSGCLCPCFIEDISIVAHKIKLTTSYGSGECTITVSGSTVKVIDSGKQLQVGNATFPLSEKELTLSIAADGTATREPQNYWSVMSKYRAAF